MERILPRSGTTESSRTPNPLRWRSAIACLAAAIGLLLPTPPCHAQDSTPGLAELQARFDETLARLDQPVALLNSSYADALARLLAAEAGTGKLDSVLEIRKEIEGFGDGSEFDVEAFNSRKTAHPTLKTMREKYLVERERLWTTSMRERREIVAKYSKALLSLEEAETRAQRVEAALAVRAVREGLSSDLRLHHGNVLAPHVDGIKGQIHFVAKGEVELRHGGSKLAYRNTSPDRSKYISGISVPFSCKVGDVVVVGMRSTAVYRSFIMAIESEDGQTAIPISAASYRYLGIDLSPSAQNPAPKTLGKIATVPNDGRPDDDMVAMWNDRKFSVESRTGSEWIKSGPGDNWHYYAVVIDPDMLKHTAPRVAEEDGK
ncbi:MAG TPA: hypothetical protein PLA50_06430 [Bacteroidia bacterium]|nr:hypothetical protein [Bacteroidia bacterium]